MTETPGSLRKLGGVDLTKLDVGTKIIVETSAGVYEFEIIDPATGVVAAIGTLRPFSTTRPLITILEQSIWDDKGKIFIPHWIGKSMRMVFRDGNNELLATHAVSSARVESYDGSWGYEVWEK